MELQSSWLKDASLEDWATYDLGVHGMHEVGGEYSNIKDLLPPFDVRVVHFKMSTYQQHLTSMSNNQKYFYHISSPTIVGGVGVLNMENDLIEMLISIRNAILVIYNFF